jgi:hypothetical protein
MLSRPAGGCRCGNAACRDRFAGYGAVPVARIGQLEVAETVRWARLGGRKRATVRNQGRAARRVALMPVAGKGAAENCIGALRWLFTAAAGDVARTGVRAS